MHLSVNSNYTLVYVLMYNHMDTWLHARILVYQGVVQLRN